MAARLGELDATNEILSLLAQQPVNSLAAADLTTDAAFALAELRHQNKLVQSQGWKFNTELSVELLKNASNRVPLAADISRITTARHIGPRTYGIDPIMRRHAVDGLCLWDRLAQARDEDPFDFSDVDEIRVDLVRLLDFEDTPDSFRHYVTIRAGRAVQGRIVGDPTMYRFSLDDEARALQVLRREDLETTGANALHARGVRQWTRRVSPLNRLESL